MQEYFIDGEKTYTYEEVINDGVLHEKYPLSYLAMCANQRDWKGVPSTTQLINGTRMEYLKITTPYGVEPDGMAFAVLGTRSHKKLEDLTPVSSFSELSVPARDEITGIADLLEQQPNGEWWLTDYKTWGSYKVGKSLGLVKKKRPVFDEEGKPVLYTRGGKYYKAGDQRMEDYYEVDSEAVDLKDVSLQMNRYRMMIETYFGIVISRLKVFAIVRDGNTHIAKGRGIDRATYYIDVPIMDNEEVDGYFKWKKTNLLLCLQEYSGDEKCIPEYNETNFDKLKKHCPTECTPEEAWDGRRCEKYCPVAEMCNKIGCKYLE